MYVWELTNPKELYIINIQKVNRMYITSKALVIAVANAFFISHIIIIHFFCINLQDFFLHIVIMT